MQKETEKWKKLNKYLICFIVYGGIVCVILTAYFIKQHNLGAANIVQLSKFFYEITLAMALTSSLHCIVWGITIDLYFRNALVSFSWLKRINLALKTAFPRIIDGLIEQLKRQELELQRKKEEIAALQRFKTNPGAYNKELEKFFEAHADTA